jgi:hypothetical protein
VSAPYRSSEVLLLARCAALRDEIERMSRRYRALVEYRLAVESAAVTGRARVRLAGALTGLLLVLLVALVVAWGGAHR